MFLSHIFSDMNIRNKQIVYDRNVKKKYYTRLNRVKSYIN